jgi:hypothetical protein
MGNLQRPAKAYKTGLPKVRDQEVGGSNPLALGKHTTGKGCLYIRKLADVDQEVLEALIVKSVAAMRRR